MSTLLSSSQLLSSAKALCSAYDVALLDLDGVCFAGGNPIEHAAQSVNTARASGMRLSFVTNNASRAPRTVVEKLEANGIEAYPEEVFSAALDAAALLKEHVDAGAAVFVIGGDGLRQALIEQGFHVVDSAADKPAAVVQGWAPEVDWAMMSEGAYAIRAGALHVITNTDATLPTEKGFALGNGSLALAVSNASGKGYIAGGKPFPGIYRRALSRAGGNNPLAVGDRLDTDLVGARGANIAGMHVLTGVNSARDVILAKAEQRPSYVHIDLRGLVEVHPEPVRVTQDGSVWWQVGVQHARVVDKQLELAGIGLLGESSLTVPLDAYRALVCAAWEAIDVHNVELIVPDITVVANTAN